MWAIFGATPVICMPMPGAIGERLGRRPVLMVSMAGMGVNFLASAWAPDPACLFTGRVVGGASPASMSVASAYGSDITAAANRARACGMIGAAVGLGFNCGPLPGGLPGSVDLQLPFYVAAGLSAANPAHGYCRSSRPACWRGCYGAPAKCAWRCWA